MLNQTSAMTVEPGNVYATQSALSQVEVYNLLSLAFAIFVAGILLIGQRTIAFGVNKLARFLSGILADGSFVQQRPSVDKSL